MKAKPTSDDTKARLALGLMQLQRRGRLIVWVDGGIPWVAPFAVRTPDSPRTKISWVTAALIIEAGNLSPIETSPNEPWLFLNSEVGKKPKLQKRRRAS